MFKNRLLLCKAGDGIRTGQLLAQRPKIALGLWVIWKGQPADKQWQAHHCPTLQDHILCHIAYQPCPAFAFSVIALLGTLKQMCLKASYGLKRKSFKKHHRPAYQNGTWSNTWNKYFHDQKSMQIKNLLTSITLVFRDKSHIGCLDA